MKLLDLFCGAGGAAMGYFQTGMVEITGVDVAPQPRYPFAFIQGDALEYLAAHGQEYDVIHASPPCQGYSTLKGLARRAHPMLIDALRPLLHQCHKPFVIENVVGAPLHFPLRLCGTMFHLQTSCGAQLRRHRLFECSHLVLAPGACRHGLRTLGVNGHEFRNEAERWRERKTRTITVTGATPQQNVIYNRVRETFSLAEARRAMGIDWMPMRELVQAIPPAYTQYIGAQLFPRLRREVAA